MSQRFIILLLLFVLAPLGTTSPTALGQSLDLAIQGNGISIGDSRKTNGIRLNFRDRNLEHVNGINMTIWQPHEPARGIVRGLAIGLPMTGGRHVQGIGFGVFNIVFVVQSVSPISRLVWHSDAASSGRNKPSQRVRRNRFLFKKQLCI